MKRFPLPVPFKNDTNLDNVEEYTITMHSELYGSMEASEQKTFYIPRNFKFTNSPTRPTGAHIANGYLRPKQLKCVYFIDNGNDTYTFPIFKSINSYLECQYDPAFYLGEALRSYLENDADMVSIKTDRYGVEGKLKKLNYKFTCDSSDIQPEELASATHDPQTIVDKHKRTWYVDKNTPHIINIHPRELTSNQYYLDNNDYPTWERFQNVKELPVVPDPT